MRKERVTEILRKNGLRVKEVRKSKKQNRLGYKEEQIYTLKGRRNQGDIKARKKKKKRKQSHGPLRGTRQGH